jgi:hypothetical protein
VTKVSPSAIAIEALSLAATLQEQLEIQRELHLRIEAQGERLQKMLEAQARPDLLADEQPAPAASELTHSLNAPAQSSQGPETSLGARETSPGARETSPGARETSPTERNLPVNFRSLQAVVLCREGVSGDVVTRALSVMRRAGQL